MFYQIEKRLIDFIDYVPLIFNHIKVHSPKLISVILEVGPETINSFDLAVFHKGQRSIREVFDPNITACREILLKKEMEQRKTRRSLTFKDYYSFLNSNEVPKLSEATIVVKESNFYIMPFEQSHPPWWQCYNSLKHDKYSNLEGATLRNALKATGALYWLIERNSFWASIKPKFSSFLFMIGPNDIDQGSLQKL
jgi:hypothetical protein